MPKFAANLSTMFPELEVPERFGAAARAGFTAVEFLRPYDWPRDEVRGWLDEAGLSFLLLNTLGRNAATGDPGASIIPGREAEFRGIFDLALDYVTALGGAMIHVTAGTVPDGLSAAECERVFIGNLQAAAPLAADAGVTLMLEPLCNVAVPDYLYSTSAHARRIIHAVGAVNVKLQYDFYHMEVMGEDHAAVLADNLDIIGHIQFSSVPGRHEPQFGAPDCAALFDYLDEIGYDGWVGAEYTPKGDTWDGLSWAVPYGFSAAAP